MDKYDKLLSHIQVSIEEFTKRMPGINADLLNEVNSLIKDFETARNSRIAVTVKNIQILAKIKSKILSAILDHPEFKASVDDLLRQFAQVTSLANDYFSNTNKRFKESSIAKELQKLSIQSTLDSLSASGIGVNIVDGIYDLLRRNVTSGGSYKDMAKQISNHIAEVGTDSRLQKYTKQIAVDSLNQYAANYTASVASDLGYEWFIYRNTLIETSRPFCIACHKKKYIHISEIPDLLKGNFIEFTEIKGKINPKTNLPYGLIAGTDSSNFAVNRGGYQCGHQLQPISDLLVPMSIRLGIK